MPSRPQPPRLCVRSVQPSANASASPPGVHTQTTCVAFTPGTKHNDLWKGCAGKMKNSISW
ncbi:unnamed protein product [Ectocarpus fasciculatus]